MKKGKDNSILWVAAGGLGLIYALSRIGGGQAQTSPTGTGGGSESYPYQGGGEGTGGAQDTAVRTELGEPGDSVIYAEIPGELIPFIGVDDSWYERRNISEVTGQTPGEYLAGWQEIIGEKFGGVGPGVAPENLTVEQRLAYGYSETRAQAEYQIERHALIKKTGGSYQGGLLTPPASWKGSVTEYAKYIQSQRHDESDTPTLAERLYGYG